MFLRDQTKMMTLGTLAETVADRRLHASCNSVDLIVRIDDGTEEQDSVDREEGTVRRGTIHVGKKEVPATKGGLSAIASFYDVPTKFFERCQPDEQQFILDHRIQRSMPVPLVLRYDDTRGVTEAYNATHNRVTQEMLVERLLEMLPEESTVVDWHGDLSPEWWGSVAVPEDFDGGFWGGDRQVGDITLGGIRFGRNAKQNLAPWVQPFLYRLACTNGMEVPDLSLKVEARNMEEFDIVMAWEHEAQRALDQVEGLITDFYEARQERIGADRTGVLRKVAQEAGLNDRVVGRLEDTLADSLLREQVDEPTMFDFINHMTNAANAPGVRPSGVRDLQRAGASYIHHHGSEGARCNACHTRLGR